MEIKGKTVIVTGAARGIGRAIARAFAAEGAKVAAADLGSLAGAPESEWHYALSAETDLARTAREISESGGVCKAIEVDVADRASCQNLVDATIRAFGGLDILVNGAGIIKLGNLADFAESEWDRIVAVNAKGVFLLSQAALPWLEKQGGVIINIASNAGKRGSPFNSAYCASKAAVIGLTQSLAAELAEHDIRVNAICPGAVFTAMQFDYLVQRRLQQYPGQSYEEAFAAFVKDTVPLSRQQTPGEIADAALYLCRAEGVTGVSLSVDGGGGIGLS
ncbi:MAG: SDR family NAD(P)-dependent oxidoreductase [Chloroflexota bacterium]|nr:SDR family NAD(P)-dependent oxidoreductase [Chloroflexota bacterium]MDE2907628.1 SDR family NAD(P)-dependent oxidoreductase [Chloroflexota bacterium]